MVFFPPIWKIPSRGLTYPTLGKGKSSSKCHFWGICSLEGMLLVKLENFPKNRDEHKNLWNHHLIKHLPAGFVPPAARNTNGQQRHHATAPGTSTVNDRKCVTMFEAERHALYQSYLHITCIFMISSGCLYKTVLYWHISRYHLLYACLWNTKLLDIKPNITLHCMTFRYIKSLRSTTWNYSLSTFQSVAWHQVTLHFIHTYMIFL